jgi:hypothetical protein
MWEPRRLTTLTASYRDIFTYLTNGRQEDCEQNAYIKQLIKKKLHACYLRWRDQHTLEEDGTDHAWPNP